MHQGTACIKKCGSAQIFFFFYGTSTSILHAFWQTACGKNRVLKFQHSKISIKGYERAFSEFLHRDRSILQLIYFCKFQTQADFTDSTIRLGSSRGWIPLSVYVSHTRELFHLILFLAIWGLLKTLWSTFPRIERLDWSRRTRDHLAQSGEGEGGSVTAALPICLANP